ncbi:MAG: secondary thiamine-phosphate synthase enzyme YjbQ [candidate division Zixibacteria bacterium]|nr:secondary thiamine-phosphate synthase enzyme YjbQ [candidate division Zixibacteria bacterium]MBU1470584.1 secondary thiamine-phosphate synthase enzyme YjbQ [candidate division Zixibacteria bacterium]
MIETVGISTSDRTQLVDITLQIRKFVRGSGVGEGFCTVFVPHTTAAVTINENADPTVKRDILMILNRVIPFTDDYRHSEGNSAAHIKASLIGSSEHLLVSGGDILLGTWQGVFFCEFDGPRTRRIILQVNGH